MSKALIALAFLGAVLIGFVAQLFLPNTPAGRALSFVAFMTAFFPVARTLWFAHVPAWRYWVALPFGVLVGWGLDVWRTSHLTEGTNRLVGLTVVALATGCLLFGTWRAARGSKRNPLG